MKPMYAFLALAALGHIIYQVSQKSLPAQANPMVLLAGAYSVALVLAALAIPLFRTAGEAPWRTQVLSLPVLALGVGVLLIELGFLLVYRRGGALQWAGVAVSGLAALVLVPAGVWLFREHFSMGRLLGILLTLAGLVMVSRT